MIDKKHLSETCKLGQGHECCRYISFSNGEFQCAKLIGWLKENLDERVKNNQLTARSDNCEGYGKKSIMEN